MWAVFLSNVCTTHNLNHICGQTAPEPRVAIRLAAHFETHIIHREGSMNSTDVQSLVRCHLEATKAHTVLRRESGLESDEGKVAHMTFTGETKCYQRLCQNNAELVLAQDAWGRKLITLAPPRT